MASRPDYDWRAALAIGKLHQKDYWMHFAMLRKGLKRSGFRFDTSDGMSNERLKKVAGAVYAGPKNKRVFVRDDEWAEKQPTTPNGAPKSMLVKNCVVELPDGYRYHESPWAIVREMAGDL